MQLVLLPRLGQTMEQGGITAWLVAEGERVSQGTPLYEVETEKAVTEVEAYQDGVLARILVQAGSGEVEVGSALAVLATGDDDLSDATIDAFLAGATAAVGAPGAEAAAQDGLADPARQGGPAAAEPPTPDGATGSRRPVLAVPKARDVARRRGIEIAEVAGTGQDGTVRVVDVLRESKARKQAQADTRAASAPAPVAPASSDAAPTAAHSTQPALTTSGGDPEVAARIPVRGIARSMADSMIRSWLEIPQFVQQFSLDATALKARLARVRYEGVPATYTDLLVAAVAATCVEVPEVNASYLGDEIVRYAEVNVSVAVATDRGLLVPVVRRAQDLELSEVAATTKALAEQARAGKLGAAELTGGTITVSNLGAFGIDTGTPIINPPQSALVFVGTMTDQPVVYDGQVVIRPRLNVAVAFDHRVLDGMTAARFSSALRTRLEAGG